MHFIRVDFPEPFGPTSAQSVFAAISNEILLSMVVFWYAKLTFLHSIAILVSF